jgi:hypothetical protein
MKVRKTKAVKATPKSVEDRGEEAAAGYDSRYSQIRAVAQGRTLTTTIIHADAT